MERRKQLLPLRCGFSQMILQGVSPVCLVTRDDLPGFLTNGWARGLRDMARITQGAILSADFFPHNLTDMRGLCNGTTSQRCAWGLHGVVTLVRAPGSHVSPCPGGLSDRAARVLTVRFSVQISGLLQEPWGNDARVTRSTFPPMILRITLSG